MQQVNILVILLTLKIYCFSNREERVFQALSPHQSRMFGEKYQHQNWEATEGSLDAPELPQVRDYQPGDQTSALTRGNVVAQ